MRQDHLKQFLLLRNALLRERTQLESRLQQIQSVLTQRGADGEIAPSAGRRLSRSARLRMAAAQKRRWARSRPRIAGPKPAGKRRRKLSRAGRARISAAAKNRWAKFRAAQKA